MRKIALALGTIASFAFLVGPSDASAKATLTIKFTNTEPTPPAIRDLYDEFSGKLKNAHDACGWYRKVELYRSQSGRDKRVGRNRIGSQPGGPGRPFPWSIDVEDPQAGRYYAKLGKTRGLGGRKCKAVKSKKVTVDAEVD